MRGELSALVRRKGSTCEVRVVIEILHRGVEVELALLEYLGKRLLLPLPP